MAHHEFRDRGVVRLYTERGTMFGTFYENILVNFSYGDL
jgi:hypothetical protein